MTTREPDGPDARGDESGSPLAAGAAIVVAPAAGRADPEVLAVLAAAVELAWPRPAPARRADADDRARLAWRFSGRWWTGSAVAQRRRPAIR